MSNVPGELRYAKTHEWVRTEDDGSLTVGISDHAQEALGDIVFVELPEVGASFSAAGDCAVVESVKAASDIYSPVSGEVIATNELLADTPEIINSDPYGDGWLFKLTPSAPADMDELLDADAYTQVASEEDH